MEKASLENEFLAFVTQNQGIAHKVCNIYCSEKEAKKDLFQEIVFQLWKGYPKFNKQSKITTWMYRVALNTAITFYRKEKRIPQQDSLTEGIYNMSDAISTETEEMLKQLYKAIEQLNKIEKALILLYMEENSYEEIAAIVGITKTNVGVKINRIKSKLERIIKKEHINA